MANELVVMNGSTGFIGGLTLVKLLEAGYRVRAIVRSLSRSKSRHSHPLIAAHSERLELVEIPDQTAPNAFDSAFSDAVYVMHLASPFWNGEEMRDEILKGVANVLDSAKRTPTIKRVILTGTVLGITPFTVAATGDLTTTYTAYSRVEDVPNPPYIHPVVAYHAGKAEALKMTDKFQTDPTLHFTIINLLPSFVLGGSPFFQSPTEMIYGSNIQILAPILGSEQGPTAGGACHIDDVVRIHIESLDTTRVEGHRSFIINTPFNWDVAIDIAKTEFKDAVEKKILPATGIRPSATVTLDTTETEKVFGKSKPLEDGVRSALKCYLDLVDKVGSPPQMASGTLQM